MDSSIKKSRHFDLQRDGMREWLSQRKPVAAQMGAWFDGFLTRGPEESLWILSTHFMG